jgi:hypothetical protein
MGRTQPTKDGEFIAWAGNIDTQCTAHQTEWELPSQSVQKLNLLTANAKTAYEANSNPELSNRLTAANKSVSFRLLRNFLSLFVKYLVFNEAVSENDLEAMGLPSRIHHAHQPIPVPTEAPVMTVIVGQHHDVTVYVSRPQHGHPSQHLSKSSYHGFVARYRKNDETEWKEEHSSALHLTLDFDAADVGKQLVVTAAWLNPRFMNGPWSNEETVLIN